MQTLKSLAASLGLGAVIGAAAVAVLLAGECSAWRQDHPAPIKPKPTVLQPTAAELEMERIIEDCLAIETLQPTDKERKRIAKESGRPEFARPTGVHSTNAPQPILPAQPGEIGPQIASSEPDYPVLLAEREVPPMPDGGNLWVWLEMDRSVTVVTKAHDPKPAPSERFWSLRPVWEIGALAGVGTEGETRWRGWGAVEPLRAGRLHLRVEGGVESRAGTADAYGMVGGVVRW